MQDFRKTKIELLSREHSAAFQKEVFEAGGQWGSGHTSLRHLTAKFLFIDSNLVITECSDRDYFNNYTYKEIFFTQGHIHQKLMAQYAEDAKTTDKPWELWQMRLGDSPWVNCKFSPAWASDREFRRKPKVKLVHGIEVPDFEFEPKHREMYYYPDIDNPDMCVHTWFAPENYRDQQRLKGGRCYPSTEEGKQAAILHAKVLRGEYDES